MKKSIKYIISILSMFVFVFVIASCDNKITEYTITWKNSDGSVLETDKVEEGKLPSYDGATPTKAKTAEYTYEFDGWDIKISEATADLTFTATFKSIKNKYNVSFVDEDGTVLKESKAYEYGTKAADIEKPENPTKTSNQEFNYVFAGWDQEVKDVTAEVTYKATYEARKNNYNVTFVDEDGTVLKATTTYAYGTPALSIEAPEDPVKENTVEYTYEFTGWDKEISAVTADVTYTATYSCVKNKYSVTFKNEDGSVLKEATLYEYGTSASDIEKPTPTKEATAEFSYEFDGWDKEVEAVTGNVEYKATFKAIKNKYNVTFVDDNGVVLKEAKEYEYGTLAADIEKPYDPFRARTAQYTYEFAGWDKQISDVTADVTYKATYTATLNKYCVTFVDEDGTTVLKETKVYDYGTLAADIEKPEEPTKAGTAKYTYEFTGWDNEVAYVSADVVYKATYTATINKYNVTFVDEDGTVLKAATAYDYGTLAADVVEPSTPTKARTAKYTYEFAGWDNAVVDVTEDATYVATYTATINKYNVTFVDEDGTTVLKETKAYEYGTLVTNIEKPEEPTKARTQKYTYEFAGWDNEIVNVTEDVTYKATYLSTINKYNVTFVDEDGTTVLKETKAYEYGTLVANIEKPEEPTKARTQAYTYEFAGWDNEIVDVTEDVIYTATYSSTINKYCITFVDEDGTTVLKPATAYEYGTLAADVVEPSTPTKARTQKYTYEFAGWDNEIVDVTEDVIYTATYSSTVNKYSVTFVDEDGTTVLKPATAYDYGTLAADVVEPSTPTKARTQKYTYEFAGWDNEVADVTEDVVYTATYSSTINKYNVTFVDEDGATVLKATTAYDYGTLVADIEVPTNVTKDSTPEYDFEFAGWDNEVVEVTEDVTYTATYSSTLRIYEATLESNILAAGELTEINANYTVHDKINLKTTLTKGYTFVGWFVNGTSVSDKLEYEYEMPTTDIEIVATFEYFTVTATTSEDGKLGHYVTYNHNYDKAPADDIVFVEIGGTLPNHIVSRTYSVLRGWFFDKECTQIISDDYVIDSDITLYAGWYTYAHDAYPTIISPSTSDKTTSDVYKGGAGTQYDYYRRFLYVAPADGTVTFNITSKQCNCSLTNTTQGKRYYGYNRDPFYTDMRNVKSGLQIPVKKGDVLYFYFGQVDTGGRKYTFSLSFYLSTLPIENNNVTCLGYDDTKVTVGDEVSIAASPKDGYTFMGWYDENDELVTTNRSYTFNMSNKNVNVHPVYDTARVLVESNNTSLGTVSMPEKTYLGTNTTLTASTLKTTGAFLGWYDENGNLLTIDRNVEVEVTNEVKKYIAKYDTRRVLVTNSDTTIGTVYNGADKQYVGENVTISVTLKTASYSFIGWYVNDELVSTNKEYSVLVTDEVVTYVAKYGEPRIKLTSNLESSTQTTEKQYIGRKIQISTTKPTGYTFIGWYDENDELLYTASSLTVTVPAEQVTYTAKFVEGPTILVALNDELGGTVSGVTSVTVGSKYTIAAVANDGYTFIGWYSEAGELLSINSKAEVEATTKVVKYIAKFVSPRVVVTSMDTTYGSVTINDKVKYIENEKCTITADVRLNYTFIGWFVGEELYDECPSILVPITTEEVIYEARYTGSKIILNSNLAASKQTVGYQYISCEADITSSIVDGYTFIGWYDENDELFAEARTAYPLVTSEGITLTAKYVKGFNIKVISEVKEADIRYPKGGAVGEVVKITLWNFIEGYTFMGWYDTKGELIVAASSVEVELSADEVTTVVAHFLTQRVQVTVNDDAGGTAKCDSGALYIYGSQAVITAIAKTGYRFVGWYLNGQLYNDSYKDYIRPTEELRIFEARFEKIEE